MACGQAVVGGAGAGDRGTVWAGDSGAHTADDCGVRNVADGVVGVHVLECTAHCDAARRGGVVGCGAEAVDDGGVFPGDHISSELKQD